MDINRRESCQHDNNLEYVSPDHGLNAPLYTDDKEKTTEREKIITVFSEMGIRKGL